MKLANYETPHPDELLLSFFLRTLDNNALDLTTFEKIYMGLAHFQSNTMLVDIKREYSPFFDMLLTEQDKGVFFLATSTIPFQAIFMTSEEQTNFFNSVFREYDKLSTFARSLFKTVNVCPDCLKEDAEQYGIPYFHREHQLSGVCCCPKHGSRLMTFSGNKKYLIHYNLEDYVPIESNTPEDDLRFYARYAAKLLQANISSNISVIKTVIQKEFQRRGYKARSLGSSFYADLVEWEHKSLFDIAEKEFSDWLAILRERPPQVILGLLMFLFPDVDELIEKLDTGSPIIEKYTCKECGKVYYATPQAQKTGWGCPECDKSLSYDDRYKRIVESLGNGEYEVLEPFTSTDQKLKHFHKICGKEIYFKPRKFIFYGERCRCSVRIPEDEMRRLAEEKGFELVSYKNASDKMTVYHPDCDRSFQVTRAWFMKHPVCRICEGEALDGSKEKQSIVQKIHDITVDEYTFLSYDKQTKKLTLQHNDCGNVFKISRSGFFTGQRCPECTVIPPYSELDRVLRVASNGQYVLEGLTKDKRNVVVLNTATNEKKALARAQIAQELSRHSPSVYLPGIKTEFRFPNWLEHLQAYKDFLRANKRQPTIREEYNGMALGAWCWNMRKLRNKGMMSEQRIRELTDAGFEWS